MQSLREDAIALPSRMDRTGPRVDWHQALAAYVEPLAADRRVAIFGDASNGLAARLVDLGARSVFVWDPDAARARREADRAPHGVIVRALALGVDVRVDAGASRGAFDLALVADLELFDDAEDVVASVRRLVGEEGAAVVAAPNRDGGGDPGAFDYYELFDLVARQFDEVTMIAQLPFHGIALAELGEDDDDPPSVTVDMQLARDRAPEAFVALASQGGVRLDRYAIVELPGPPVDEPVVDEATRVALEEALLRAASLEASLQTMRDRAALAGDLEAALVERTRQLVQLAEEVEQARAATEIERVTSAKLEEAARRAERADAQLEEVALRAARADAQLDELAVRAERAEAQLREALRRAERAEQALTAFEPEVVRLTEAHAAELARYEEGLRELASTVRGLEAELVRRERMVKELVDAVDEMARAASSEHTLAPASLLPEPSPPAEPFFTPPTSAELAGREDRAALGKSAPTDLEAGALDALHEENARLRRQLDSLALDLARREGEAHASAWTIAELQRDLELAAQAPPPPPVLDPPPTPEIPGKLPDVQSLLSVALDEIDVLRQALAQEHAARQQAESNEELAKARAEIKRQAARLEELGDRSFGDRPD
jgi:hypothetical protein